MTQNRGWKAVTVGKPPVGAYSPAVRAGDFLFLSGQVPIDPDRATAGVGWCDDQ
jgi:2-iminobutanoate/2-iminopropanoate deaminase